MALRKPNRRRPVVSVTLDTRTLEKLTALQGHWGHTYQTQTVEKLIIDEWERRIEGKGTIPTVPDAGLGPVNYMNEKGRRK